MWSSSEAESKLNFNECNIFIDEGQYVVTEELIKLFRFLYLNSP
jgi:hypothetical protein